MENGLNLSWHLGPLSLAFILLLCLLYGGGISYVRRKSGQSYPLHPSRLVAFACAVLLLIVALLSPLDIISRTQLFSAHMVQMVVLTTLCAPLLIAAIPEWLLQPLLSQQLFRRIFVALTHPLVASILFNLIFLGWHAPIFYNLAIQQSGVYTTMLLSIFVASILNWWPLIGPLRELRHMSYPQQMLYAFLDGQPVDIFAFLIVFTGVVFYPHYAIPTSFLAAGFTPIEDQTVSGAFMLIPGIVDLIVMSPLFFRWLGQMEQQARQADERRQEEAEAAEVARLAEEQAAALTSDTEV